MHKIQAAGVTAVENMKADKVTRRVLDTILLNLRAKFIRPTIFRFVRIINSRTRSSGYTLKSNPSIINDK